MKMGNAYEEKALESYEKNLDPPREIPRQYVDEALTNLYLSMIGASWSNDQFTNYQDAWKMVEQSFAVEPFDWTKGERPKTLL